MGPLLRLPFEITYFLNRIANKVFGKRGYWLIAKFKKPRVHDISTTEKPYYQRIDDPQLFLKHYMELYRGDYQARKAHAITRYFPDLRGKVALDLGVGGGFYSLAALRQGAANVVLIDVSKVCIKAARLNIKSRLGLKVDGIVADATKLPLRDRHFDFILCIDLVEHVKNDRSLIRESFRILRATGFLLISTQNSSSLNYILESFIQRKMLRNPSWMGWDPTHLRFYNPSRLLAMIRSLGFLPIKAAGTYFIPYMLTPALNRLFGKEFTKILYATLIRVNDVLERRRDRAFLNFFGWGLIVLSLKQHNAI